MIFRRVLHRFQAMERLSRTAMVRCLRQRVCRVVMIATIATAVLVSVPVSVPAFAQTQTQAQTQAQIQSAQLEGIARQRAAAGWLRLELVQRESRQRAGPATPAESDRRQAQEWEEALRYRALLQQQDREIQSWRRQDRIRQGAGAGPATQTGQASLQGRLMQLESAQRSQRLRMQMDRERRSQTTAPGRSALR